MCGTYVLIKATGGCYMQETIQTILCSTVLQNNYYEDNLSQNEIAKKEHVSRPHISRLLEKAREYRIVDIRVRLPEELQVSKMEQQLKERLGLNEVVVVLASHDSRQLDKKISMNIATAAAEHLPGWIKGCKNVGVGWGFTIYQTSLQLSYCNSCEDIIFFPLHRNFRG